MSNLASGRNVILRAGDYQARAVAVGAGLAELTFQGTGLVTTYGNDEFAPEYMGKILIPWPNRIEDGQFTREKVDYQLPINDLEHNAALHGFMSWVDWQVAELSDTQVTFKALVPPRPGYPWTLRSTVHYVLDSRRGLTVTVQTTNIGHDAAPYGVAAHPYFAFDGELVDNYELEIPALTATIMNENLIPMGTQEAAGHAHTSGLIGNAQLDDAYTDLPEGTWQVTVRNPSTGHGAILSSDTRWLQVYSGDELGRTGVAVEPMSCGPNAFNSGNGLAILAAGASHRFTYSIQGIR